MRHYDFEGPLIQTRTTPLVQHPPADARDYLLLEDLVGSVIELELELPAAESGPPVATVASWR